MKKKVLSLLLAGCMTAATLAGCGSGASWRGVPRLVDGDGERGEGHAGHAGDADECPYLVRALASVLVHGDVRCERRNGDDGRAGVRL